MDNICIPIHLDAFALSPGCCSTDLKDSNLAPYTQPNYTSLRLDSHLIQHDVLDHVDFHSAAPASKNPRLADLSRPADNNLKRKRMGVHLSWSLPRFYRSAQASGKTATPQEQRDGKVPNPNPVFRPFPTRWLVVRQVVGGRDAAKLKTWQSWIVQSDARHFITSMDPKVDLESEVAPFVTFNTNSNDSNLLQKQTEVFIGQKFDAQGWGEVKDRDVLPQLTIMSSSNPLFADNALHNTNVLSMIDNFAYPDGNGIGYPDNIESNYFVVGWHSSSSDDPFNNLNGSDLASQLSSFLLQLDPKYQDPNDKAAAAIRNDTSSRRCVLHGAIYNVKYDFSYDSKQARPESLANLSAHKFTDDSKMEPLSIGTTPLDGILTFLEAHKPDIETFFGKGSSSLTDSLMSIAQLLYASGDNYDSRIQAQDIIAQQNFGKAEGGGKWVFAETTEPGKPAIIAGDDDKKLLARLNDLQTQLDSAKRQRAAQRWELFAEWWKQVSKYIPLNLKDGINGAIKPVVIAYQKAIGDLSDHITSLETDLNNTKDTTKCKLTTKDPFHTRMDPTLTIAGLKSGWPSDWQDKLTVTLQRDLAADDNTTDTVLKDSGNPVTTDANLHLVARRLLTECVKNKGTPNGARDPKTDVKTTPRTLGYQSWGDQNPFVPIFIEWEGIYYHVGPNEQTSQKWKLEEKWQVKLRPSPVGHLHQTVRYVPTEDLSQKVENHKDFRSVSGRVLVLPQPVFSLEVLVKAVLDSASKDVQLTQQQKDDLKANISQLQFVSAPLSGLTNHLLTRFEGAHIKPVVRAQGARKPTGLKAAERIEIGMSVDKLELIDAESAVTPYGDSFPFGQDQYPGTPFKPVTHGQLILTKINIIDKFGQAICLPKVLRRPRQPPDVPTSNIYPCLSDWLSPDVLDYSTASGPSKLLNTVLPTTDPVVPGQWPRCQYIQLTPSINQDARLNGSFLVRDTIDKNKGIYSRFREANDYDPMIWGWVVINYADNGLQFFQGDGRFYREIRRGGVSGTNVSQKWLPYDPPPQGDVPQTAGEAQLAAFIDAVKVPAYFQRFCDVINNSIKDMPFPPSDYSAYASAIVGKPLALVNCGWSLELAAPAIKSQNTIGNPAKDVDTVLNNYTFPLKLGDVERNYDGVVGYWNTDDHPATATTHWDKMYTYFAVDWDNLPQGQVLQMPGTAPPYTVLEGDTLDIIVSKFQTTKDAIKQKNPSIHDPSTSDNFVPINPSNFLKVNPYHIDGLSTDSVLQAHADKMKITTLLIDPYTAIHGYSPILPTKSLTLPPWTVQTAFEKMHAFFHLGPMLLTSDVPITKVQAEAKDTFVKLPLSGKKGTWNWFQPYPDDQSANLDPTYAQMQVQEDLEDKKFDKPPYTFIEGLLELMGSLEQKKQVQSAVAGSSR